MPGQFRHAPRLRSSRMMLMANNLTKPLYLATYPFSRNTGMSKLASQTHSEPWDDLNCHNPRPTHYWMRYPPLQLNRANVWLYSPNIGYHSALISGCRLFRSAPDTAWLRIQAFLALPALLKPRPTYHLLQFQPVSQ